MGFPRTISESAITLSLYRSNKSIYKKEKGGNDPAFDYSNNVRENPTLFPTIPCALNDKDHI